MKLPDPELIHRDAVCSLYYDSALPGSYVIWHGFASSAAFRETCMRSLDLTREKRLYKSIADARQMRVIGLSDQKWFTEEFLPMTVGLNISPRSYSAVIVPNDFFGRQSLDSIIEQVNDAILARYENYQAFTRYFDSYEDARAWLLTVDASTDAVTPSVANVALPMAATDDPALAQAA